MKNCLYKRDFNKRASTIALAFIVATSGLLGGCTSAANSEKTKDVILTSDLDSQKKNTDNQAKIMEEYNSLIKDNSSLTDILKFIDKNIPQSSKTDGSAILDAFENAQKNYLTKLSEKYYEDQRIQDKISKIYKADFDINKLDSIEDAKVKALLTETRDSGYKVDTAEGMFYPVINYEVYKKYSDSVSSDMKDYIDIMAVESNKAPAKDAALVISWDEMVNRAANLQKFIGQNKDSIKLQDIKNLYKKYITFTFLGLNNTPLFKYTTKVMSPEAKKAYGTTMVISNNNEYYKIIGDYLKILEKNNYTLTPEVDKYRKDTMNKLLNDLQQKPQVEVPVELKEVEGEQKSVDQGHSPWKLDPIYVAQVFISLKISPEGIKGDYPIKYEDLKITDNTGNSVIVTTSDVKSPIKSVYLKRLIKQDDTGIWTVVGYDPVLPIVK